MKRSKSIGVFDSGFGGLDILRGIVKRLPEYNYMYLGDTARTPYGTRSPEIVYEFTRQAVEFLFKNGCELVILACNTASSEALRKIQKEFLPKQSPNNRVLGVIIPTIEFAARQSRNHRIGIIATEGTVSSRAFERELLKLDPRLKVFQKATPLLVPIVETGVENSRAARLILADYLTPLIKKNIDTLILGCTHYGILESKIKNITGKNIRVLSEAPIVANKLNVYLKQHPEIERKLEKNAERIFYSTDITKKFNTLGSKFFGKKIKAKKAVLG